MTVTENLFRYVSAPLMNTYSNVKYKYTHTQHTQHTLTLTCNSEHSLTLSPLGSKGVLALMSVSHTRED